MRLRFYESDISNYGPKAKKDEFGQAFGQSFGGLTKIILWHGPLFDLFLIVELLKF